MFQEVWNTGYRALAALMLDLAGLEPFSHETKILEQAGFGFAMVLCPMVKMKLRLVLESHK